MATGRKAWPGCRHCWAEARTPPRYPRRAPAGHRGRAGGYGRARRDRCAPLPCALHTPGQARRGGGGDCATAHDGDPWAPASCLRPQPRTEAPRPHPQRDGAIVHAGRSPCFGISAILSSRTPPSSSTPGQAHRGSGGDCTTAHDGDPWALPRAFVHSPGRKHRDRIHNGTVPSRTRGDPHASASVPSCPPARRLPPARPDRCIAAAAATAPPRTMAILGRLPRAFVHSPGRKHRDRVRNGAAPSCTPGDPHASASAPSYCTPPSSSTPGQAHRGGSDDCATAHDGDPSALPRAFVPSPGRKHRDRVRNGTVPSRTRGDPHASASAPSSHTPPSCRKPGDAVARPWQQRHADGASARIGFR
jgi:hypothetical protein